MNLILYSQGMVLFTAKPKEVVSSTRGMRRTFPSTWDISTLQELMVDLALLGSWLALILEVFSSLNDSMIVWLLAMWDYHPMGCVNKQGDILQCKGKGSDRKNFFPHPPSQTGQGHIHEANWISVSSWVVWVGVSLSWVNKDSLVETNASWQYTISISYTYVIQS